MARELLERGLTSDRDTLQLLQTWRFHQNAARRNVMREGQEWALALSMCLHHMREFITCSICVNLVTLT